MLRETAAINPPPGEVGSAAAATCMSFDLPSANHILMPAVNMIPREGSSTRFG